MPALLRAMSVAEALQRLGSSDCKAAAAVLLPVCVMLL